MPTPDRLVFVWGPYPKVLRAFFFFGFALRSFLLVVLEELKGVLGIEPLCKALFCPLYYFCSPPIPCISFPLGLLLFLVLFACFCFGVTPDTAQELFLMVLRRPYKTGNRTLAVCKSSKSYSLYYLSGHFTFSSLPTESAHSLQGFRRKAMLLDYS